MEALFDYLGAAAALYDGTPSCAPVASFVKDDPAPAACDVNPAAIAFPLFRLCPVWGSELYDQYHSSLWAGPPVVSLPQAKLPSHPTPLNFDMKPSSAAARGDRGPKAQAHGCVLAADSHVGARAGEMRVFCVTVDASGVRRDNSVFGGGHV